MNIFGLFEKRVADALARLAAAGKIPSGLDVGRVVVEPPRDPSHGDLATNAAMVLAKEAKTNPARACRTHRRRPAGRSTRRQGRGRRARLHQSDARALSSITTSCAPRSPTALASAASGQGAGGPVNVEFVSANPTGPMHVGHGRGAVFGDALANLLDFAGAKVTREYYINDAGAQVDVLARSAYPALPRGARRGYRRDPGGTLSRRLSEARRPGAGARTRQEPSRSSRGGMAADRPQRSRSTP